ncbi:UNVERIFIED_CONTAM: calcium binding egf domain-containing protein [Hammondia hammondi]|eukprot:XP_008883398.1 calcium binding egf domain-containing protein [Hammondia hammondi]
MGNQQSGSSSPCDARGFAVCAAVPNAVGCKDAGDSDFFCTCADGFRYQGRSDTSKCDDINECHLGTHNCTAEVPNSICENTKGSYICVCGDYRELRDGKCEDKNECMANNGGCGANSICNNNSDASVTCSCMPGYEGNGGQPGIDCTDIDECENDPCPVNSSCINTSGSFKCECAKGFSMGSDGVCVAKNYCDTDEHDCDPILATCKQLVGSYTCECKPNLTGNGKKGNCIPKAGYEDLPCELSGGACGQYSECVKGSDGTYSCTAKSFTAQLSTVMSEGLSGETPGWIWGMIAGGALVVVILVLLVVRKFKKKSRNAGELVYDEYGMADGGASYDQYGYGSTDYYYS